MPELTPDDLDLLYPQQGLKEDIRVAIQAIGDLIDIIQRRQDGLKKLGVLEEESKLIQNLYLMALFKSKTSLQRYLENNDRTHDAERPETKSG